MSITDLKTVEEFWNVVNTSESDQLLVVHFWAEWAPQCNQMNAVMQELAGDSSLANVSYYKLEAESIPEISSKFKISAVPTLILIKNKTEVERVDGANAGDLTRKIKQKSEEIVPNPSPPAKQTEEDLNARLKRLTNQAACMLFMKGNPEQPRCGFSRQTVQILNEHNVDFETFDILGDNTVREGLKKFSNWPTYPQLYVNGELLGGLDIVKEMIENGDFSDMVPKNK